MLLIDPTRPALLPSQVNATGSEIAKAVVKYNMSK